MKYKASQNDLAERVRFDTGATYIALVIKPSESVATQLQRQRLRSRKIASPTPSFIRSGAADKLIESEALSASPFWRILPLLAAA